VSATILNPYLWALRVRELLYRKGVLRRCRPPFRTVSVGNLSLGGSGKTSTVLELARFLLSKGFKVAVLLRGYGRRTKGPLLVSRGGGPLVGVKEAGDEAYLYASRLRGVWVAVAERRCEGVELLKPFKPDYLLLDDAFQHLAVERDLDALILTPADLTDRLLPFGRLREPLSAVRRAHYCLLSKTRKDERLENLCRELKKPFGYLRVVGFELYDGERNLPFETLKGKRVGIISALGDNEGFQKQVLELADRHRFEVVKVLSFRDHSFYEGVELDPSLVWITTFKDYYKLPRGPARLLVLERTFRLPPDFLKKVLDAEPAFGREV